MKQVTMTCGPYNGLRLHDADGNVILHHDATAKMHLIDRAIDCLRVATEGQPGDVIYDVDGERYAMKGGVGAALIILRAIRERG